MSISRGTRLAGLGLLALGSLLGLASPARADYPVAPDVVVFCEPTLQHVVADIGALWRARTGIKVRVFTSPTPALLQQIAHHARDDVVIGEGDAEADAAADQHLIKKETVERIWSNHLVVASLSGELRWCRWWLTLSRQTGSSRRQGTDCRRRSVGGNSRRR